MEISASGPLLNGSRDLKNYVEIMQFFMKQGTTVLWTWYSLQSILQFIFYSPPGVNYFGFCQSTYSVLCPTKVWHKAIVGRKAHVQHWPLWTDTLQEQYNYSCSTKLLYTDTSRCSTKLFYTDTSRCITSRQPTGTVRHIQAAQSAVEQTRSGVAQYAVEQKSRVVSQFFVAKTRPGVPQLLLNRYVQCPKL